MALMLRTQSGLEFSGNLRVQDPELSFERGPFIFEENDDFLLEGRERCDGGGHAGRNFKASLRVSSESVYGVFKGFFPVVPVMFERQVTGYRKEKDL